MLDPISRDSEQVAIEVLLTYVHLAMFCDIDHVWRNSTVVVIMSNDRRNADLQHANVSRVDYVASTLKTIACKETGMCRRLRHAKVV